MTGQRWVDPLAAIFIRQNQSGNGQRAEQEYQRQSRDVNNTRQGSRSQAQCHESGCHSLQLHITHGLHLPSCTAHTHSRPPLHNHTAVTIHSLVLIASPHLHLILTLTYKQHTYTHPLRSLVFPWLTFPSVFPSLSSRVLPGLLTPSPDRLLPASLTPPAFW